MSNLFDALRDDESKNGFDHTKDQILAWLRTRDARDKIKLVKDILDGIKK